MVGGLSPISGCPSFLPSACCLSHLLRCVYFSVFTFRCCLLTKRRRFGCVGVSCDVTCPSQPLTLRSLVICDCPHAHNTRFRLSSYDFLVSASHRQRNVRARESVRQGEIAFGWCCRLRNEKQKAETAPLGRIPAADVLFSPPQQLITSEETQNTKRERPRHLSPLLPRTADHTHALTQREKERSKGARYTHFFFCCVSLHHSVSLLRLPTSIPRRHTHPRIVHSFSLSFSFFCCSFVYLIVSDFCYTTHPPTFFGLFPLSHFRDVAHVV